MESRAYDSVTYFPILLLDPEFSCGCVKDAQADTVTIFTNSKR